MSLKQSAICNHFKHPYGSSSVTEPALMSEKRQLTSSTHQIRAAAACERSTYVRASLWQEEEGPQPPSLNPSANVIKSWATNRCLTTSRTPDPIYPSVILLKNFNGSCVQPLHIVKGPFESSFLHYLEPRQFQLLLRDDQWKARTVVGFSALSS